MLVPGLQGCLFSEKHTSLRLVLQRSTSCTPTRQVFVQYCSFLMLNKHDPHAHPSTIIRPRQGLRGSGGKEVTSAYLGKLYAQWLFCPLAHCRLSSIAPAPNQIFRIPVYIRRYRMLSHLQRSAWTGLKRLIGCRCTHEARHCQCQFRHFGTCTFALKINGRK